MHASSESGGVLVLVAVTLPVVIMLASFVIDVGNWYEHKRHLQLQVDSAALAGGGLYAAKPCSNTAISAEARKYAGPAATGGGTYNAQVGSTPSANLHVLINSTNFYNQAYSRQGWADIACEVCERWQAGDRDGAASLVIDEMVLATTLIGTESMVRQRLGVWRDAGVDTVRLYPAGTTLDDRLATLGRPSKSCMRSAILHEPHHSPNATRGTQPGISRMLWAISSVRRGAAPSSLPCGSTAEGPRDRVPAAPRYAGDSRRRR